MTPSAKPKATATAKGAGNTKRVNKPLIDLPKKLGGASAKLQAKGAANSALYAKQQKMAQDKKKKLK